jgi:hypothetical protein
MTLWIWLVAAIVLALVGFEIYNSFKRRAAPAAATDAGEEPGAELVRAQMKITILENRLSQSQTLLDEEKEELHTRYREKLARTEAAYQKQMVALRERLQPAVEQTPDPPQPRYEVRMAGEVEAWLETSGAELGLSAAEPVAENLEETAVVETEPSEQPAAEEADEETAVVGNEALDVPEGDAWRPAPEEAVLDEVDVAALAAQVKLLDDAPDSWEVEDIPGISEQIQLLDDPLETDGEAVEADVEGETAAKTDEPAATGEVDLDAAAEAAAVLAIEEVAGAEAAGDLMLDEAQPQLDEIEELVDALAEADAVEALEEAAQEAQAAADLIDDVAEADAAADLAQAGAAAETAVVEDGSTTYEGRWPDLEEQARQRVLARRLGAELDADYLDDEEFMREMGIAMDASAFGGHPVDAQEDMMGGSGRVTDPLEEMARHMAVQAGTKEPEPAENGSATGEPESDVWEAFVYNQALSNGNSGKQEAGETKAATDEIAAEAAETAEQSAAPENGRAPEAAHDRPAAEDATGDGDGDASEDEDAMIAATVAAILSRVPDQEGYSREPYQADPEYLPRTNGKQHSGTNGAAKAAQEGEELAEPEKPAQKTAVPDFQPVVRTVTLGSPAGARAVRQEAAGAAEMVVELPAFTWEHEPITWEAEYFANAKLAEEPTVVRKDKEIDFDWGGRPPAQGVPARTFSVRWTGAIALEPGEYRFSINAPDGVRLWLNDRLMISAWYDQSMQAYHRDFAWNGGSLHVRLEHYENGGDARAFMTWERIG